MGNNVSKTPGTPVTPSVPKPAAPPKPAAASSGLVTPATVPAAGWTASTPGVTGTPQDGFRPDAPAAEGLNWSNPVFTGNVSLKTVLAKLGTLTVHESDVRQAMDTLGFHQSVTDALATMGAQLGLTTTGDESPEAYGARVIAEANARGKLKPLETNLRQIEHEAHSDGLFRLLSTQVLQQELTARHLPLPADPSDVDAMAATLRAAVAPGLGYAADSEEAKQAVAQYVDQQVTAALWAPHAQVVNQALGAFSDTARSSVLDFLTQLYAPALGADGPRTISGELAHGGAAAELVTLIAGSRKMAWNVSDLETQANQHPELQALMPRRPKGEDPVLFASTPVSFTRDEARLRPVLGKPVPDPLLEQVKAGKVQLAWVDGALAFQDGAGKDVADPATTQGPTALIRGPLLALKNELANAFKLGQPPFAQVVQASGLTPYLGAHPLDFALAIPGVAEALKSEAIAETIGPAAGQGLTEKAKALGLPDAQTAELANLRDRLKALKELQPMPFDLGMVAQGKSARLSIPLTPGAKLTAPQRDALAAVQHYFDVVEVASGGKPSAQYGELTAESVDRLKQLIDVPDGAPPPKSLDLTPDLMRKLLCGAAAALPGHATSSAELLLQHPILDRPAGTPPVDPLRLVVEYAKAQGFKLADPPALDANFYAAISASAKQPVDEKLLEKARASAAQLGAFPPATRDALLKGQAFIAGEGGLQTFVVGQPMNDAEAAGVAQRLAPLTGPMTTSKVVAGERHLLPTDEPIAALKLVLSKLGNRPIPVKSDGVMDAYLTGSEVRELRDLCLAHSGAGPTDPTYSRWSRVADAVDRGQVVLGDLNDTPGKTPLEKDVNGVLGDLRQMVQAIAVSSVPESQASAAVAAQQAQYDKLERLPDPQGAAQRLLADHFKQSLDPSVAAKGALTADDLGRLTQLATELGSSQDPEAKAFVEAAKASKGDLDALAAGLKSGAVRCTANQVTSKPKDAALETRARRALDLLVQGGNVLQTQARAKNQGLLPSAYRLGLDVWEHALSLPSFSDNLAFNAVKDWTVVSLKSEMAASGKGAQFSISPALRQVSQHVDAKGLRALLAEGGLNPQLAGQLDQAATALEQGKLQPWDAGQGKDPAQAAVDGAIASAAQNRRDTMTQIDGDTLRFLAEKHGDMLGRSVTETLISGEPSTLPGGADAKKLLLKMADKMPPPWSTLNVTLQDTDPDVRTAKALVQEALGRMTGGSKLWGGLVPGRDANAVDTLAKRMAGMDADQLAPFLKGFCVQQGFISSQEAGDLHDPKLNAQTLHASVLLAKKAADIWSSEDPDVGKEMADAAKTLGDAEAKGQTVSLADTTSPAAKALRRLVECTAVSFKSKGEDRYDFAQMLQHVPGDLTIRHPAGNRVSDAPLSGSLSDVPGKIGQTLPWTEEKKLALASWSKNLQWDTGHAVQTAVASTLLFKHLMGTMIGYDLWVSPFIKSGKALYGWASGSETGAQARSALSDTWKGWLDMQASMTAYLSPLPFAKELKEDIQRGKLDTAAGKAVVYLPMMWGAAQTSVAIATGAVKRILPRKPFALADAPIGRSEAVAIGDVAGPAASRLSAGSGRAAQLAGALKDAAFDPKSVTVDPVTHGIRWLADKGGLRSVSLDTAKADFKLSLPEETARWVSSRPNGHLQIELTRGGKPFNLDVANKDLIELAKYEGKAVPKELADRMGLTGRDAAPMTKALMEAAKKLPPAPATATGTVPALRDLVDPAKARGSTVWRVEVNGAAKTFELKNASLAELVKSYYVDGPKAFEKTLAKAGLTEERSLVQAVVANYQDQSAFSVKWAGRAGSAINATSSDPAGKAGKVTEAVAEEPKTPYAKKWADEVSVKPTGEPILDAGSHLESQLGSLEGELEHRLGDQAKAKGVLERVIGKLGPHDTVETAAGLLEKELVAAGQSSEAAAAVAGRLGGGASGVVKGSWKVLDFFKANPEVAPAMAKWGTRGVIGVGVVLSAIDLYHSYKKGGAKEAAKTAGDLGLQFGIGALAASATAGALAAVGAGAVATVALPWVVAGVVGYFGAKFLEKTFVELVNAHKTTAGFVNTMAYGRMIHVLDESMDPNDPSKFIRDARQAVAGDGSYLSNQGVQAWQDFLKARARDPQWREAIADINDPRYAAADKEHAAYVAVVLKDLLTQFIAQAPKA